MGKMLLHCSFPLGSDGSREDTELKKHRGAVLWQRLKDLVCLTEHQAQQWGFHRALKLAVYSAGVQCCR